MGWSGRLYLAERLGCGSQVKAILRLNDPRHIFKEFRGQGLFEASMEEIRQITIREKLPAIRLHVNKQNTRAINAYKKYGFAVVEIKAFDIGHGYFMDDYVMEYALK